MKQSQGSLEVSGMVIAMIAILVFAFSKESTNALLCLIILMQSLQLFKS